MNRIPKYSICVINMNTEDTLYKSMQSVCSQLNEDFEVVIVDESRDGSRVILEKLRSEFPIIRNIFLSDDKMRTIGDARNISVQESRGTYCIIHVDCDDFWFPYISEFVKVFETLEKLKGEDFLLAGHQINMAKRDFLLSHGPYRNVEHGEDRDLWMRLAKLGLFQPIDHVPFFYRMDVGIKRTKKKALLRTYWSVRDEIRGGVKFGQYWYQLFDSSHVSSMKTKILRVFLFPFAFMSSKKRPPLSNDVFFNDKSDWNKYKEAHGGLFSKIVLTMGQPISLDFLSPAGKWIFSNKRSEKLIYDLPTHLIKHPGGVN